MLRAAFNSETGDADLVYSGGRLVDTGFDVETNAINSLFSDAPAQDGDVLAPGTPRRGYLGDIFDERGHVFGSRLWLLEGSEATQATAERAKTYALEALQWMIDDRHITGVAFETEVYDEDVGLAIDLTTADGRSTRLGPFKLVNP